MKQFLKAKIKVFALITGVVLIGLVSCQKNDESIPDPVYTITYTTYGMQTPYLFAYITKEGDRIDTIKTQSFQITVEVKDSQFGTQIEVSNLAIHSQDSLYVKAERNGKKSEWGFYFTGGWATITTSIQGLQ